MAGVKRLLVPALLAFCAVATAQNPSPNGVGVRVRLAYGFTPDFDKTGGSGRMEGPEIAVALPVTMFLGNEVLLEPSFFGGGRFRHGGDDDADVYRISALLRHQFASGFGLRAGVGFATSSNARGGGFKGKSAAIFDVGADFPLSVNRFQRFQPSIDVHGLFSDEKVLSGFFVGLGARF